MKDLIPVTQNENGELLVSTRNLHKGLEIERDWLINEVYKKEIV